MKPERIEEIQIESNPNRTDLNITKLLHFQEELIAALEAAQAESKYSTQRASALAGDLFVVTQERNAAQTENTRLRTLFKSSEVEKLLVELDRLTNQITDLQPYIQHLARCRRIAPRHCDCGLSDVRSLLSPWVPSGDQT